MSRVKEALERRQTREPGNTASADNKKFGTRVLNNLTALKEQYGHLAQVEVDEVTGLVRHIRAKVASNNAVPCRIVFLVKFLFDESSNILK